MANEPSVAGQLVEEEVFLTLEELCAACAAERQDLLELLEQGLLEADMQPGGRFAGGALRRMRMALRLRRDLGVNAAGAVLVVELLERIHVLEGRESRQGGGIP